MTVTKVRMLWTGTTLIMSPCNMGFGVRLDCDGYLRCNSHRVRVCLWRSEDEFLTGARVAGLCKVIRMLLLPEDVCKCG